jgi:TRAP-type C4-dicarboxylate transport system permease small subunit
MGERVHATVIRSNNSPEKVGVRGYYFKITRFASMISGIFIFALMIFVTTDVTSRFIANSPLRATLEISQNLMIFIVFLALPHTQAVRMHLRLDFFFRRLSPLSQAGLEIVCCLIGFLVFGIICWQGCDKAWEAWSTSEYMEGISRIPYFPARFGLALGSFLLWFQYSLDLFERIRNFMSKKRSR